MQLLTVLLLISEGKLSALFIYLFIKAISQTAVHEIEEDEEKEEWGEGYVTKTKTLSCVCYLVSTFFLRMQVKAMY